MDGMRPRSDSMRWYKNSRKRVVVASLKSNGDLKVCPRILRMVNGEKRIMTGHTNIRKTLFFQVDTNRILFWFLVIWAAKR